MLGFAQFWFFHFSKDVERKRRLMPVIAGGTGVLFLLFVVVGSGQLKLVLFMGPFVALISYINIRNTTFCGACGKTVYNQLFFFSKIEYCAKCGAKL